MGLHGLLQGFLYLQLQIYEIGYGLDDLGVGVQVPGGVKNVHHIFQTGSGVHPTSFPVGAGVLSPAVKWPGREADHSPPTSAEVKKMFFASPHTPSRWSVY
jgi:hypothetical protein